jgi:multisubunit Na+/H+ antiporter MnhG subunit
VIGVGIALIVLGVVFLFVVPWVGLVTGAVGLVLAFLWVAGVGGRVIARDARTEGNRR